MAIEIKLKHSSTAGKKPAVSDLVAGEVAINTADEVAYIKNASGAIVPLTGSGSLSSYPDVTDGDGATLDARYVKVVGDDMTGDLTLGTDKITLNATNGSGKFKEKLAIGPNAQDPGFFGIEYRNDNNSDTYALRLVNNGLGSDFSVKHTSRGAKITDSYNGKSILFATTPTVGTVREIVEFSESGNVLIGGTLPASPNISLNAAGTVTAKDKIIIQQDGGPGDTYLLGVGNSGDVRFSVARNGTTRIGGNASVGSATSNITLNADGSAVFKGQTVDIGSTGFNKLRIGRPTDGITANAFVGFDSRFEAGGGSDNTKLGFSNTSGGGRTCIGIPPSGYASFQSLQLGTNLFKEVAQFDENGNLAIGGTPASSPNISLKANGTSQFTDRLSVGNLHAVVGKGAEIQETGTVLVRQDNDAAGAFAVTQTNNQTNKTFVVAGNGTLNIKDSVILKPDGSSNFTGDMAIGTTGSFTPSAPAISLKANGSAQFQGGVEMARTLRSKKQSTFVSSATGNLFVGFDSNDPNASGIVMEPDGTATFTGTVTATVVPPSDQKFKENITPANPQLADVVALGKQLKNFNWNDDAPLNDELRAVRQLGLIAQEAEKVSPGIVKTIKRTKQGKELTPERIVPAVYKSVVDPQDEENYSQELVTPEQTIPATYEIVDDSFKGISHDALIMKLLGAVAELSAEVEALKAPKTAKTRR